jgi:uncharacterized protein YndB with AHSA1/START domain
MSTSTETTQIYRVYIKASAQAIWDAITQPEWTERYGYTGLVDFDLRPGGAYKVRPTETFKKESEARFGGELPEVIIDGQVVEADPPHKLVHTFRMLMDPGMAAEPYTRITYEIKELENMCSLTLTHELEGAPKLASLVRGEQEEYGAGGGHAWVLSELKTVLETGKAFAD